jgi:hypothetical protein
MADGRLHRGREEDGRPGGDAGRLRGHALQAAQHLQHSGLAGRQRKLRRGPRGYRQDDRHDKRQHRLAPDCPRDQEEELAKESPSAFPVLFPLRPTKPFGKVATLLSIASVNRICRTPLSNVILDLLYLASFACQ